MGLSAAQLADYTYRFALGGIDIIKDDHGLANQPFAPFQEQVEYCLAAVERANRETGRRSIYVPNITAPVNPIRDQALFAKKAGVGGLMISPGLTGFDTMRWLAEDDEIGLPIINHPALQGSFVISADMVFPITPCSANWPVWRGPMPLFSPITVAVSPLAAKNVGKLPPGSPWPWGP